MKKTLLLVIIAAFLFVGFSSNSQNFDLDEDFEDVGVADITFV